MPKAIDTVTPRAGPAPPASGRQTDPRSLRSQEALRSALLRLIDKTLLEKITLREITIEARVSYPTFFNHFSGKDDLFEDIARKEITDFLTQGFRQGIMSPDWRPGEGICRYITDRRGLWRTLLTTGASGAMRTEFIRLGREMPSTRTGVGAAVDKGLGNDFPIDVVSGVIASGTFEIIAWWLGQDPDYPVERIADMLETLVIEPALILAPGHFTRRRRPQDADG